MLEIISRPRRGGKTVEALRWLHEKGGGTFVTRIENAEKIESIIHHMKFKNINIVHIPTEPVAVDDVDMLDTAVTTTMPFKLITKFK